jgi:hypothetical protein
MPPRGPYLGKLDMERASLLKFWDEAWAEGLWAGAWSKSVQGLTPQQAAWKPAPDRHSSWQIVAHIVFWREHEVRMAGGGPRATDDERHRLNFPDPPAVSEAAWQSMLQRLAESQQRIRSLIADERTNLDRIRYLLPHDCYHVGQICYVRALQSLPPIE